jgi:hypothetical protein
MAHETISATAGHSVCPTIAAQAMGLLAKYALQAHNGLPGESTGSHVAAEPATVGHRLVLTAGGGESLEHEAELV